MGQFKQDGVNFNIEGNLRPSEKPYLVSGKLVTQNAWANLDPEDTPSKIINAIEIDWNDADFTTAEGKLPTTGKIQTTGQLIGAIKWAASQGSQGVAGPVIQMSKSTIGGAKLFDDTKQTDPVNQVSSMKGRTYAVQLNNDGQLVVNVPWLNSIPDSIEWVRNLNDGDNIDITYLANDTARSINEQIKLLQGKDTISTSYPLLTIVLLNKSEDPLNENHVDNWYKTPGIYYVYGVYNSLVTKDPIKIKVNSLTVSQVTCNIVSNSSYPGQHPTCPITVRLNNNKKYDLIVDTLVGSYTYSYEDDYSSEDAYTYEDGVFNDSDMSPDWYLYEGKYKVKAFVDKNTLNNVLPISFDTDFKVYSHNYVNWIVDKFAPQRPRNYEWQRLGGICDVGEVYAYMSKQLLIDTEDNNKETIPTGFEYYEDRGNQEIFREYDYVNQTPGKYNIIGLCDIYRTTNKFNLEVRGNSYSYSYSYDDTTINNYYAYYVGRACTESEPEAGSVWDSIDSSGNTAYSTWIGTNLPVRVESLSQCEEGLLNQYFTIDAPQSSNKRFLYVIAPQNVMQKIKFIGATEGNLNNVLKGSFASWGNPVYGYQSIKITGFAGTQCYIGTSA